MPSNKKLLQAAAGSAGGDPLYVEDVFSTYLYSGTDATQVITNGVDMTEGGLVWCKTRATDSNNVLVDSEYSMNTANKNYLVSNTLVAGVTGPAIDSFNSTGFTLSSNWYANYAGYGTYASWSFRKAEKFFDVVTYTGNATSGRTIAHSLGSTPGMMIVKQTSGDYNWQIYHSGFGATKFLEFNTGATQTSTAIWNDTAPTDSVFTVGNEYGVNRSGYTYVAYLFASDAGGYGDDGTENIIKCGSFSTTGSSTVTLGFEPQWFMVKQTNGAAGWYIWDTMRGWTVGASGSDNDPSLYANTSGAEVGYGVSIGNPTATGFVTENFASGDYIYMAIRRPMKTPEAGTEVFDLGLRTGSGSIANTNSNILTDAFFSGRYDFSGEYTALSARLQGNLVLQPHSTSAEIGGAVAGWDTMTGALISAGNGAINTGNLLDYSFKRAAGFMDVVAYSGTGVAGRTVAHNLGVAPDWMVIKCRNYARNWCTYHISLGNAHQIILNSTAAKESTALWNSTTPTATEFTLNHDGDVNGSPSSSFGNSYIAYLFATLAGVSKVGSYTGTGADLNVDCGFTAGARFILIKRTDSSGGWYYWDSVRGISAGNDPYLLLNTTGAQVTGTDYVDPLNAGFTVTSNASSTINVNGGTYIFLAIA